MSRVISLTAAMRPAAETAGRVEVEVEAMGYWNFRILTDLYFLNWNTEITEEAQSSPSEPL